MQRNKLRLLLIMLSLWATVACAATISFSTTAPADANDAPNIASIVGATLDRDNIGGDGTTDGADNDGSTYVAADRGAQGQTFVTGSAQLAVTGIWVQHVGYSGNTVNTWYTMAASSQLTIRIVDPSAVGTAGFMLGSETCTIAGTEENVLPSSTTNTADGTGTWIHIELDTPILLSSDTTYGFDIASTNGGTFFELSGIRDGATGGNPYSSGSAYVSGASGVGDNSMTALAGDRIFVVEMGEFKSSAANPDPADGAVGVDSDAAVTLSWDAGKAINGGTLIPNPDILYHYVYLSGANDPNLAGKTPIVVNADVNPADGNVDASASYTLTALLDSDSTYYWRVDEILNNGTGNPYPAGDPNNVTGTVWSFDTEKKQPQLDSAYPLDAAVAAGELATFTVKATNPLTGDDTGMTYQWYRNATILTGEVGYQYERTAASADDRSTYYCFVTVTATGKTVQSRAATLYIKKELAYWPFDGSVEDASADGLYDGTLNGTAFYETGQVSHALSFDGSSGYVSLPSGFDSFSGGLTFTLWAKPTAAGSYARFLDFGNGAPSDNIYLSRTGTEDTLHFSVYVGETATSVDVANVLETNEWQMLSVTMDQSGSVVIYKNGVKVQTGTVTVPANIARTLNYIGRSNWTEDAYYQGLMDEIHIYNYPRTANEIAAAYYAVEGEFCQVSPAYDFTGPTGEPDCVVDIYELRALAVEWLGCGIYPECY